MPRQPREQVVREREAIRDRVKFLLEYRWEGNQRQMARDMGVSQGLISKIANGLQGAGRRFLLTLARQPGVNADWLLHGAGQPLSLPPQGTLPIAMGVLPGPPSAHPQLLTGQRHPVAESLNRASRYWLELQQGSPLLRDAGLRLLASDLLLMETDRAWTSRVDLIEGRLCGVCLPFRQAQAAYVLGKLYRDPLGLLFDALDMALRMTLPPAPPTPPETVSPTASGEEQPEERPRGGERRKIRLMENEEGKLEPVRRAAKSDERGVAEITLKDVVAVGVYLARPSPVIGQAAGRVEELSAK